MTYRSATKFLFLFIIIAIGCKREAFIPDQLENGKDFQEQVELEFVESLEFEIDSIFNIDNLSALGTFEDNKELYLYFLTNERLYVYQIEDRALVKVIPFTYEGPNATGPFSMFDGLIMKSLNTIYFINHSTGKLYHLNGEGEVVDQVNISNSQPASAFYSYTFNDLQMAGDRLLLPTYGFKGIEDFTTTFTGLLYDWETQSKTGVFYYPEIYNQVYWGYHTFLRWSSVAYSPERRQYFVSFAVDPRVYVYDEDFILVEDKYVGSTDFTSIEPQSEDAERWLLNEGRNVPGNDAYFAKTPFFFGSMFHRESGTYVRMARHGIDKDSGEEQVRFSLIFADGDLNKTGEYFIPGIYSSSVIFSTPEGLAFFNADRYDWKEKKITFDVLRFRDLSNRLN